MQSGRAPGQEGFPGFFSSISDKLLSLLLNMFNDSLTSPRFPATNPYKCIYYSIVKTLKGCKWM